MPVAMILPLRITIIWSNWLMYAMSHEAAITVVCCNSSCRGDSIFVVTMLLLFKYMLGSSSKSILGLISSARAKAMLFSFSADKVYSLCSLSLVA